MSAPIEQCLFVSLYNASSVTALVSGRIYPMEAPASRSYPYIVYRRIGGDRIGSIGGVTGMAAASILIECWGKTYASAKTLANTVRQALNGLGKDTAFGGTYSAVSYTTTLDCIWMEQESDEYDFETKTYGVLIPFKIWHQED